MLTVLIALVANAFIAATKTVAAAITGSASMVAEAAHSWADTGNEIALVLAERRGSRPRDASHPRGYGRATYFWSLIAAFGLFLAGSVVSLWHGGAQLWDELRGQGATEDPEYLINYVVLTIAFVLEGTSLLQASREVRTEAARFHMRPLSFVRRTSDSTLRAVFFEDASALIGLLLAAAGIGLHEITGDAIWDALGSMAIGVLLGAVALFLIRRNADYLLGQGVDEAAQAAVAASVLARPEVARLTYLHLEIVGPQRMFMVAAVDLVGDDREHDVARRLRALEAELETEPLIEDAVLTLSGPDEADIVPHRSTPVSGAD